MPIRTVKSFMWPERVIFKTINPIVSVGRRHHGHRIQCCLYNEMSELETKDEGTKKKAERMDKRGEEMHIKDLAYGVHRVEDRKEKK